MHIVLWQQEKPLEVAAQTDKRIDKRPREYEIEGDIEPVGRLLQEHARCGGYIAEPPEDAGIDVLEEILEIRVLAAEGMKAMANHAAYQMLMPRSKRR